MFLDFIVYYIILDVTISHIITVKSLIVSFFGGGLDRCDIIIWGGGQLGVTLCDRKCWKKRDIINEWPLCWYTSDLVSDAVLWCLQNVQVPPNSYRPISKVLSWYFCKVGSDFNRATVAYTSSPPIRTLDNSRSLYVPKEAPLIPAITQAVTSVYNLHTAVLCLVVIRIRKKWVSCKTTIVLIVFQEWYGHRGSLTGRSSRTAGAPLRLSTSLTWLDLVSSAYFCFVSLFCLSCLIRVID